MNKQPYFLCHDDGTFSFLGYFESEKEAITSDVVAGFIPVVNASFLYRTIAAAQEALNNMPLPEECE